MLNGDAWEDAMDGKFIAVGLRLGIALGIALGAAIGAAFHKPAVGVSVGVSLGTAVGVAIGAAKAKRDGRSMPNRPRGSGASRRRYWLNATSLLTLLSRM